MANIFREAKQLLETKSILEMTQEEVLTVNAAQIPLDILPEFNHMTTLEGLEVLARLLEEASRGNKKVEASQAKAERRKRKKLEVVESHA
ncbi:unnamed protein product [marine sediment metagenome]|uniref:Uncharacterized protein n=1 Tax=marine sediment metagenome TaxID=412755 RepID=X1U7N8_9ZZZZ